MINPSDLEEYNNLNDNFWKWFGNSKMKDKNGMPIKFYHLTYANFNIFEPIRYIGYNGIVDYKNGRHQYYFSRYKDYVIGFKDDFTSEQNKKSRIIEVYLKIENPLVILTHKAYSIEWWLNYFKSKNINFTQKELSNLFRYSGNNVSWAVIFNDTDIVKRRFNEAGYDGCILKDVKRKNRLSSVMVFDSNQIKSVNNKGNWSLENNSIYANNIN